MDRARISNLAHAEHPIAAPLHDDTVDRLLRRALRRARTVGFVTVLLTRAPDLAGPDGP